MKILNLPKGSGKTIRMLYASEFNDSPIVCCSEVRKANLLYMAKQNNIQIPTPISLSELIREERNNIQYDKCLIDDIDIVTFALFRDFFGLYISGATITLDKGLNTK